MRLHHLELEAFGPFAGHEQVDFEQLTVSGLFLLCGQTGAGKTSVLDAVCFGLFGRVPGERDKAKRLHSDHAGKDSGPRVVLEVTVRGRRLRITRSAEWMRPKKRGTGEIREQAKVLVEERVDEEWQQRTNRLDEAGDLVGSLLGMTMSQFCQVAMLPQGRFETFLRAGAQERHVLLEKLFATHRFRAVEEWLTERRRALTRLSAGHAERVAATLERVGESSGLPRPDELEPDEVLAWSDRIRRETATRLTEATQARAAADQAAKVARTALDDAHSITDLQARYVAATSRDDDLRALADSTDKLAARVEAARRATEVHPHIEVCDAASLRVERTEVALLRARGPLPADAVPARVDSASLAEVAGSVRRQHEVLARLEALLPVEDEVTGLDAEIAGLADALDAVEADLRQAETEVRESGPLLESVRTAHAEARSAAGRLDPLRDRLTRAERMAAAAGRLPRHQRRRRELADARERAVDAAQRARDSWLDLRQARLEGMAAELAHGLGDDTACPVCGSPAHPAPAEPVTDPVTAESERAAEESLRRAEEARERRTTALARGDEELAALLAAAEGVDPRTATARLEAARGELDRASDSAAQAQDLADELAETERGTAEARRRSRDSEASRAQLSERRSVLLKQRSELRRKVTEAAGSRQSLTQFLRDARDDAARWEGLLQCMREHADALRSLETAQARLTQAVCEAEFDDVDAARRAAMARTDLGNAETLLRRRADQAAQVRAVLDDPAVVDAAAQPPVDVAQVTQRLAQAQQRRDDAVTAERALEHRSRRLETLHHDLEGALAAWRPVRGDLAVTERLAALCAGTSTDNRHRMRLSAYVLAARLEQVVAAANERLLRMSSGRYTLQHSVARGVGDTRGGLGLQIHDAWTGESRDPATLSGGETFVTSLALALGLADVVSHEAGGTEIATLFVDEGFGSLDPETLDEVMDVLDQLRSGGRAVGIVSHVADLRARVPAQVHVRKSRTGSTLRHP